MTALTQRFLLLLVLLLCGSAAIAETLYRWVDDKGQVTFQGQPPIDKVFTREDVVSTSGPAATAGTPQIEIIFYAVEVCEACDLARQDLIERGMAFTELNPEKDLEVGKSMIERFGKVEVPLILIGDAVIKGYNPIWLDSELAKTGVDTSTTKTTAP